MPGAVTWEGRDGSTRQGTQPRLRAEGNLEGMFWKMRVDWVGRLVGGTLEEQWRVWGYRVEQ